MRSVSSAMPIRCAGSSAPRATTRCGGRRPTACSIPISPTISTRPPVTPGLMHNYADATGSREMKFLSTTCDVSVLIARNNIEEAYERILSLDTVGITRRMRASYYTQQMVVFGRLASGDGSEARRKAYADSLFQAPPHTDRFRRPLPCHAAADVCPRTDGSEPL
ncbi:MAG: hypothetical protein ACLUQ6_13135 [Alistipes onderdonkii]